ncbi:SRPBCC domain-containing protein [Umezawaea endophytica]|uniref:SRPBCC domain-containing protein n=1 Tax=Umezawaea endophytica TaxID=1654476 RepID=A0A9X3AGA9_9PSEU|nr:SRPBCC domain-containing protein [Umezawaea endophytica]MCS7479371.1 SRPBCC domain-containing protein [Umezawaea endophytica]
MDERRRLAKEVELAATPDEVWEAISTPEGMSVWFVPHERVDGEVEADFGGGNTQAGQVLAWEPGERVVYGAPGPDGEPPMTLEFLVEGRGDGTTVLRLVQSGFFGGDDWEAEYDGFGKGWDMFLHNLAEYFRHFSGRPVANVVATASTTRPGAEVWADLVARLGADPALGDRVRLTPEGLEPVEGVVDLHIGSVLLGVRTEQGFYRFMVDDAHHMVNTIQYFYGVQVDRESRSAAWQAWVDDLAGAPGHGRGR